MDWLRLRLRAFHQGFPGNGYGVAYLPALWPLAVFAAERHYRALELAVFVVAPTLAGLSHFVAPRSVRGGKPYWFLAALWLTAAACGGLAHWSVLGPASPWLSLARYVLFFSAFVAMSIAPLYARPLFVREIPPRFDRRSYRVWAALYTLFLPSVCLAAALMVVPLRLALAPPYSGAKVTRLFTEEGTKSPLWLWWRPDGRALLALSSSLSRDEVSLISMPDGKRTKLALGGGTASDQPWLPDSSGFYYLKKAEGKRASVWLSSADGKQQRLILPNTRISSGPAVSPNGTRLAYASGGIMICDLDGSHPRRLTDGGRPQWSPDGKHLLLARRIGRQGFSYSVASLSGDETGLSYQGFERPMWLNDHQVIGVVSRDAPDQGMLSYALTLEVWDVDGKTVKVERFPHVFDLMTELAPAPDGRRVAFTAFRLTTQTGIYVLDLPTGRLYALPLAGGFGEAPTELRWSPDGRRLAYVTSGHDREESDFWTLGVIDVQPLR